MVLKLVDESYKRNAIFHTLKLPSHNKLNSIGKKADRYLLSQTIKVNFTCKGTNYNQLSCDEMHENTITSVIFPWKLHYLNLIIRQTQAEGHSIG